MLLQVTCHDSALVIIHRALELHLLIEGKPEDCDLCQIISYHRSKWDNQMVGSKGQQVDSGQLVPPNSTLSPTRTVQQGVLVLEHKENCINAGVRSLGSMICPSG